jgi:uncharacterized protein YndB with AHSA1/START domain
MDAQKITVETTVHAPIAKVWQYWTEPGHIMQWNNANFEWHTPNARNDLRTGGDFVYRMEAKDGSFGFDFGGKYDQVSRHEIISYVMEDGRRCVVKFAEKDGYTKVTETFDAETQNSLDLQRAGWQAILDNFKRHVEEN